MSNWKTTQEANEAAESFADFVDAEAEATSEFIPESTPLEEDSVSMEDDACLECCENCQDEDSFLTEEEEAPFLCLDCNVSTLRIREYYMVQFKLWELIVPNNHHEGMLCIGCVENRLGRQLVSEDFIEAPINYMQDKSERLLIRLGSWFRDFDGPFENRKALEAAVNELEKRDAGLAGRSVPAY